MRSCLYTVSFPNIHYRGEAGAYPSCHWERGRVQPGQVTRLSQETDRDKQPFTLLRSPINRTCMSLEAGAPGENHTERPVPAGNRPQTFLLWGDNANHPHRLNSNPVFETICVSNFSNTVYSQHVNIIVVFYLSYYVVFKLPWYAQGIPIMHASVTVLLSFYLLLHIKNIQLATFGVAFIVKYSQKVWCVYHGSSKIL